MRCTNTGTTIWLGPEALEDVGCVRLGSHLYDTEMRLLSFEMPRHPLPISIPPGKSYDAVASFGPLPSGVYVLAFDLVSEFVTWFEALGTVPATIRVLVR